MHNRSKPSNSVKEWLGDKDKQTFRLFGYAGIGKTTLAKEIASLATGGVLFGAFTGKALLVMRCKVCKGTSTIHSVIYTLESEDFCQPKFVLIHESHIKDAKLVVIDECSIIDEALAQVLLSFGAKILVLGDLALLPTVKSAGFLCAYRT